MNRQEYKQLSRKMLPALEEKLKSLGHNIKPVILRVRQIGETEEVLIGISNEVYVIYNDGNNSRWDFLGYLDK